MKTEPVTRAQVAALTRALSFISTMLLDLGNVDLQAGRGVLENNDRCLWTKDGRRITISLTSDGGCVATISKKADPEKPQTRS